jgi:hypothetical protein
MALTCTDGEEMPAATDERRRSSTPAREELRRPDHATLPASPRARLFEAIGEIIDGQFGGRVERHSTARLQLARRR